MVDWCSPMHHDNEGAFATKEVDQDLKEGVDREGFVDIAERIDPEGDSKRGKRCPRCSREYGYEDDDAYDMSLEERFAVVLGLEEDRSGRVSMGCSVLDSI